MGSPVERVLGAVVGSNNRRVQRRSHDRHEPNPRPIDRCDWNQHLEASHPAIRAEWDAFIDAGGGLPPIADLIAEDQGNRGGWHAGLLISKGKPATDLATTFPATLEALRAVPGIWSALWSVLDPGAEIPEHCGPNAGVLRYHLGVDCGDRAALRIGATTTPYRDGVGLLFDDTAPHSAWNHGDRPRTTLFLEVKRPLPQPARLANDAVQLLIALDPRYRKAPRRADALHRVLNPPSGASTA